MANPIRRIVQLVLDKAAAARAEADARRALKPLESGLDRLRSMAKSIGAAIGGAFLVRSLVQFGAAAVREANTAERVWNNLRGTIQAAGGDFNALEKDIRATGDAFQDATVHDGEGYAEGLERMISLTGDVRGSMQNMGLAANVAAQFFKGELEPAIELVAKVSMGMTAQLGRMGIQVETAQEGLDVLAKRSLGAAARQMETNEGKLKRLNNVIGDFREAVGDAINEAGSGTSVIETLTGAVRSMTQWVLDNKDELRVWVTSGINVAVAAIRNLITFIRELNQARGAMSLTAGGNAPILAENEKGLERQIATFRKQRQQAVREQAAALAALEKAQNPGVGKSVLQFLGGPAFTVKAIKNIDALELSLREANDQLEQIDTNAANAAAKLAAMRSTPAAGTGNGVPGLNAAPVVISNGPPKEAKEAKQEKVEMDDLTRSYIDFAQALHVAEGMHSLLGDGFDINAAKSDILKRHLEELIAAGLSPADPYVLGLVADLGLLEEKSDEVGDALAQHGRDMGAIDILADSLGESYDALGAKASSLEGVIAMLAANGFEASDPVMVHYIEQLNNIGRAMELSKEHAENYGLAVETAQALIVGALGGNLKEVAAGKAKENALLAAEQVAHGVVSLLNPFTAAKAPGHFTSAAKFGAIAAGWAALGSAIGGGGASGGGAGGGSALGGGRGASGPAADRAPEPQQEVHIHLVGPGFNALNPQVQKVVHGAMLEARQRFGNNARVNIHTTDG